MPKEKLLFVTPHLSTGGMPQYVVKLVETLKQAYDIYVLEYHDYSPEYVVQKNALKKMLGDHVITFYGNDESKDNQFFELINKIKPNIIHLQEIPEMWMTSFAANKLYNKNRQYKIVETSHDSGFKAENKRFARPGRH